MWLQRSIRRRPGPGPGHLQLQQQPERNGGGGSGRVGVPLAAARGFRLRPPGGGGTPRGTPPASRRPATRLLSGSPLLLILRVTTSLSVESKQ